MSRVMGASATSYYSELRTQPRVTSCESDCDHTHPLYSQSGAAGSSGTEGTAASSSGTAEGSSGIVELSLHPDRKRYPRDRYLGTEVQVLRIHHPSSLVVYSTSCKHKKKKQPSNNVQLFQGRYRLAASLVKNEESNWKSKKIIYF